MDATPENAHGIGAAKNRIRTGPIPEWVRQCDCDWGFKDKPDDHLTHLLFDRQVQVERREIFFHTAIRLETREAVERHSQWRLEFEPRTQSQVLHFVRLRRAGVMVEQLGLEKGHLLQREEGLERLVINGWFTFLQVLEDVRPGDILEWAHTTEYTSAILPDHFVSFFTLPDWVAVGKYHFTAHFNPARGLKWKASTPEFKPEESQDQGLTVWQWTAEKYAGRKREPHMPAWYLATPWIQISDCPDWQTVSMAVARAWAKPEVGEKLEELVKEVEKAEPNLAAKIARAINLVQDEFRYLSVNLEFGGQIPAPPETVARQRYGDCKDLSFLLVQLLQRLGVSAQPVLVHAGLGKTVGDLLPTAGSFNHVIVEFEAEGKRRWVDPTMKGQGGGAFNRVVHGFGLGLPISAAGSGLVAAPQLTEQSHVHELRETILVDTTGAPSRVSMVVRAEGQQAEFLRREFALKGLEAMARESLQHCANRFGRASRIGTLRYRDDREANQFFTAEVFEINGFLTNHPDGKRCRFRIPSHWINHAFLRPEATARRAPFALPFPYQVNHIIDVEAATLRQITGRQIEPRLTLSSPFIQFHRTKNTGYRFWVLTFSLKSTADAVPAEQLTAHRELVDKIRQQSAWILDLPLGYAKLRETRGFGELPDPAKTPPPAGTQSAAPSIVSRSEPITAKEPPGSETGPVVNRLPNTTADSEGNAPAPGNPIRTSAKRRRHKPKPDFGEVPLWLKVVSAIFALLGIMLIIIVLCHGSQVSR